jgi:hypothetical protein
VQFSTFVVYFGDESTNQTVLLAGNIVESFPYYAFQPDADLAARYLEAADRHPFHRVILRGVWKSSQIPKGRKMLVNKSLIRCVGVLALALLTNAAIAAEIAGTAKITGGDTGSGYGTLMHWSGGSVRRSKISRQGMPLRQRPINQVGLPIPAGPSL